MAIELFQEITNSSWLINTVIALSIFILGLVIGKILEKVIAKVIIDSKINELVKKSTNKSLHLDKIIGAIVKYAIYFTSAIMALNQLGIATTILNIISGAILILVLILFFLSLKDFIPNATAGLFVHTKGFLAEGDKIKLQDIEGVIKQLGLVETEIKTKEGDSVYIPNSKLIMYEVIKKVKKEKR